MKTAQVELIEVRMRIVDGEAVYLPGQRLSMFSIKGMSIDDLREAAKAEAKRRTGRRATVNFGTESSRKDHFTMYAKVAAHAETN